MYHKVCLARIHLCILVIGCIFLFSCKTDDASVENSILPDFEQTTTYTFSSNEISEASGVVSSHKNPGKYWVHNDGGNSSKVFLIDSIGTLTATIVLDNAKNRDWEDIASYKEPLSGKSYIYLADIGDNFQQFDFKYIYRFEEPKVEAVQDPEKEMLQDVQKITFQYPDDKRDAETLLIDPLTSRMFVISKWEDSVNLYGFPEKFNWEDTLILEKISKIPIALVVGGDISSNGLEVLVETYDQIFYWKRANDEPLEKLLNRPGQEISYTSKRQEEGICWNLKGQNFIVVSESDKENSGEISYYTRKK